MVDLLYALAYIALPIAVYLISRNLTWTVAIVTGSVALVGAFVTFVLRMDGTWSRASLQWATLGALLLALVATVFVRRRSDWPTISWRRHLLVVGVPFLAFVALLAVSRLAAGPRAGFLTGVGFLIRRQHAEDNAKWLDFTGQYAAGHDILQSVPMGGPLQLFLVIIATVLAAASLLILGGVNEVFVAANTVVYAEYFLVAMVPFVFAPLVEARVRRRSGSKGREWIPAPVLWAGMLVLGTAILAASGLGHLTLEFVLLAAALWVGIFLLGSRVPHVYALSSLAIVTISLVWFPLLPISAVVLGAGVVAIVAGFIRGGVGRRAPWGVVVAWVLAAVFVWPEYTSTVGYMTDGALGAATAAGGMGGGIHAAAPALVVRALDLLTSGGGTEEVGPVLGLLLALSVVLAVMYLRATRRFPSRARLLLAFGPAVLLGAYAIALMVIGTWWAGDGPNYGAVKMTFMVTSVVTAVAVPLALMEIDRRGSGTTVIRIGGIAVVIYLLAVDGILPRAGVYISPQQWPDAIGEDRGYWWPAEVRTEAEQTIASLPIACAYRPPGAGAPSALPNGQTAYACTRILTGLSGADSTGQPLVDWQRREWFTNTTAWYNEYPGLLTLPEDLRRKNFILMDELDQVVGVDSVQSFMGRYMPDWAQEQPGG